MFPTLKCPNSSSSNQRYSLVDKSVIKSARSPYAVDIARNSEWNSRDHNGYYVRWGGKSRSSQHYSIIICVDETADISQIEVSICLRYVTECIIREIFIGFYPTEATERKCSLWPGPSYALTQQRSSDYVLMGRPTWVVFTVASPHSWLNAVHLKHCTSIAMPIC